MFSFLTVLSLECNAPIDSGSKSRQVGLCTEGGLFVYLFVCNVWTLFLECLRFYFKDKKRTSAPFIKQGLENGCVLIMCLSAHPFLTHFSCL